MSTRRTNMKTTEYIDGGLKIKHVIDNKKHRIVLTIGCLQQESRWYDLRRILMFEDYVATDNGVFALKKLLRKSSKEES